MDEITALASCLLLEVCRRALIRFHAASLLPSKEGPAGGHGVPSIEN